MSLWSTAEVAAGNFAPEIVLSVTILVMLIVRTIKFGEYVPGFLMALVGVGVSLYYTMPWLYLGGSSIERTELFTGMLVCDAFTCYIRSILLIFALLFIIFTRLSRVPDPVDSVDFYCLVLGSTIGMCLMASANHLLMVFMAVEMASVPSYALAGSLRNERKSSEAALKYSIYGAGAAGVMLYGISLIAGVLNTAHIPTMAAQLAANMSTFTTGEQTVLAFGGLMLMVGLAFKLSAFPFHFWCPDVFEGASAEVGAFLSIASKAAALALLVRVSLGVGFINPNDQVEKSTVEVAAMASDVNGANGFFAVADEAEESASDAIAMTEVSSADANDALAPVRSFAGLLIALIAAVTCTFGNLAAYGQTNIKRLMAYSTIAHAGYMMLAIPAALAVAASDSDVAQGAIGGLSLYIATYVIMNLGAFAVIAFLRNSIGSEEIADYAGLVKRSPIVVIIFSLILFSLVGLPPLAGFLGKFAIFRSLASAYGETGQFHLMALLVVGGINTAISLFYYLRVVKVMTIDPETDAVAARPLSMVTSMGGAFLFLIAIPVVTLLVYVNPLNEWTLAAAKQLF